MTRFAIFLYVCNSPNYFSQFDRNLNKKKKKRGEKKRVVCKQFTIDANKTEL